MLSCSGVHDRARGHCVCAQYTLHVSACVLRGGLFGVCVCPCNEHTHTHTRILLFPHTIRIVIVMLKTLYTLSCSHIFILCRSSLAHSPVCRFGFFCCCVVVVVCQLARGQPHCHPVRFGGHGPFHRNPIYARASHAYGCGA